MMPKSIDAGVRVRERQQAFRNQGLCSCGRQRREGISARTKKPYQTCQRCSQRAGAQEKKEKGGAGAIDRGRPLPYHHHWLALPSREELRGWCGSPVSLSRSSCLGVQGR